MKSFNTNSLLDLKRLCVLLLVVAFSLPSYAQNFDFKVREVSQKQTAAQIKAHNGFADTIVVRQDKWDEMRTNYTTWGANLKFKSVHAFVKFYVDHAYPKKVTEPYTLRLAYKILGFSNMADTTAFTTTYDTLTISYKADSLAAYQDIQYKKYSNYHKIMIIMTNLYRITSATSPPQVVDMTSASTFNLLNFTVEGAIRVEPFHKRVNPGSGYINVYGPGSPALATGSSMVNDNLNVVWNLSGANLNSSLELTPVKYELEWTYVDNYRVAPDGTISTIAASSLPYNFKNNSTRVWVDTNYYQIPLIYQQGYLLYRVRMVRPDSFSYQYPIYGAWSLPDQGTVSSAPAAGLYSITNAHLNDSLNWQYTVSFAEQGRYKQVMSYYDGMLKSRQSITRFNSMPNKLIATEQVYDYEGRPSISILPTPVNSYTFHYQNNLSLNALTNKPYKAADFDGLSIATCPLDVLPSPLAPGSPAFQYYSPSNPDQISFQKYVPDAGGYPFVQTLYSPGYEERIDKQGGAGDSLQIGRGHTIKNSYVSAEQMDLNRLFGLNIGWSGFYRKTVSKDPNGQYSLNVTDYHGKTVASSMVGIPDTAKLAIVPNTNVPDTTLYNEDFIAGTPQQILGNKRVLDKLIFNDAAGNNSAQYIYGFTPYPTFCLGKFLSVKAHYDYTITDECGTLVTHDSATLGTTGVLSSGQAINSNGAIHGFYMEQGQQSIHKELTVNTDDVDAAVDKFMKQDDVLQGCLRTEPSFIKDEVLSRQFPCPGDLEHMSCPSCGSLEYEMIQELWPNKDSVYVKRKYGVYDKNTSVVLGNDNSIFTMLCHSGNGSDFAVTDGQVRNVIHLDGTITGTGMETSGNLTIGTHETLYGPGVFVLDGNDTLHCHYRYQDTCLVHLPASVVKFGHTYTHLQQLPVDTFIYLFSDSIAQTLLPLHPEYCNLLNCVDDAFEKKLSSIPDAKVAEALGLLKLHDIILADPLYAQLMTQPGMFPNAFDTLSHTSGGVISLDTLALVQAYCNCNDSVMLNECYQHVFSQLINNNYLLNYFVKDRYFHAVQSLYRANRQRYLSNLNAASNLYGNCATCHQVRMHLVPGPVFTDVFNPNGTVSTSSNSFIAAVQSTSGAAATTLTDFINMIQNAPANTTAYNNASSASASNLASANSLLCTVPVDLIINQLVNCADSISLVGVRNSLLALCNSGQVQNGNFTPQQIRDALTNNSIPLTDICNPYLINYDQLSPSMSSDGAFSCNNESYYSDMSATLTHMLPALQVPGGILPLMLSPGNQFEAQLINSLGGNVMVNAVAAYNAATHTYTMQVSHSTDVVKLYFKTGQGGICAAPFNPSTSGDNISLAVECINNQYPGLASGYIDNYAFTTKVTHQVGSAITQCNLVSWNDKIGVNIDNSNPNPIATAVPVTQMRALYQEFWDTLGVYQVQGVDHPYYAVMLRNFMNYRLKRSYSGDQYVTFIESAALADSMKIPVYGAYSTMIFLNGLDTVFNNAVHAFDTTTSLQYKYWFNLTGTGYIAADFNQLPLNKLRVYIKFMNDFVASHNTESAVYMNMLQENVLSPNALGVYINPDLTYPVPPGAFSGFNVTSIFTANFTNGLSSHLGQVFSVNAPSGGAFPADNAYQAYLFQKNLFDNGIPGYYIPFILPTVNQEYTFPDKKAYLRYAYSAQNRPTGIVLDTLQAPYLTSGVPAFNSELLSYGHPAAPGSIEHLYVLDPATATNGTQFNKLGFILDNVKAYFHNITGVNTIFFNGANTRQVLGGNTLTAYRCADTAFWYRYFGSGDTLYNVFVRTPAYLDYNQLSGYVVQNYTVNPGDGNSRSFKIKLTNPSLPGLPLELNGYTDFVVAHNEVLHDVVLAHATTEGIAVADTVNNCERQLLNSAIYAGKVDYKLYIDSIHNRLRSDFFVYTMNNGITEHLNVSYRNQRFNYTLYHYDRAGNLMRTVPPAGTVFLPNSLLLSVDANRQNNVVATYLLPGDNKISNYSYNSLNQVVKEFTPDGGDAKFFYDAAGRMIFSQNDKQKPLGNMTYTLYDAQSRIVETGEAKVACPYFEPSKENYQHPCSYYDPAQSQYTPFPSVVFNLKNITHQEVVNYVRALSRDEVVVTSYDNPVMILGNQNGMSNQENLRKRVATIRYFDYLQPLDTTFANYTYAMHFSYDIEGNVKTLTRDYPGWKASNQEFKRVDYDYDVISGKVNMLSYNRSFADQFFQRYRYDADNRITTVETSSDGFIWKRDAAYEYYQHGPLARMSLGDLRVQGIDYAYTLQGWLKAVNGDLLDSAKDMGADAAGNSIHAKDAIALSLDYFKGDYKPIGSTAVTYIAAPAKNLYNGNIPRASTSIAPFPDLSSQYTYDQLNRIVRADYATINRSNAQLTNTANYYSSYAYDVDGNLQKLVRNGNKPATLGMDTLVYRYANNALNDNKLQNVNDYQANNYQNDIKQNTDQYASRYLYDPIGNMIKDLVSGQDTIQWSHYNKVSETHNDSTDNGLRFSYDGLGNRYSKSVTDENGDTTLNKSEINVRDAQGNILAIYNDQSKYVMGHQQWVEYITTQFTGPCGPIYYIGNIISPNFGQNGYFKSSVLAEALGNTSWAASQLNLQPVSFYMQANNAIRSNILYATGDYSNFYSRLAGYSVQNGHLLLGNALNAMTQDDPNRSQELMQNLVYRSGEARTDLFDILCDQAPALLQAIMDNLRLSYSSTDCSKNVDVLRDYISTGNGLDFMTTLKTLGNTNPYSASYRSFLQSLYSPNTIILNDKKEPVTAFAILCQFAPDLIKDAINASGLNPDGAPLDDCNHNTAQLIAVTQNSPGTLLNFTNNVNDLGQSRNPEEYRNYVSNLFLVNQTTHIDDMQEHVLNTIAITMPDMMHKTMQSMGLIYDDSNPAANAQAVESLFASDSRFQDQFLQETSDHLFNNDYPEAFAAFVDSVSIDSTLLQYPDYTAKKGGHLISVFQEALNKYNTGNDRVTLAQFFDTWTPARRLLAGSTDSTTLLSAVYDADVAGFLNNYVTAQSGNMSIVNNGLVAIHNLTLPDFLHHVICCVIYNPPCGPVVIDSIVHNIQVNVLKYQRINLASHILYGSSRLGTKDYLPTQYYSLWDSRGPSPIVDTTQLNGRRPWYSREYNDDIVGLNREPWNATDVSSFYLQDQVGQKQYELNNLLGNVQATVTDLPVQVGKTNDSIKVRNPALATAYDYYPFGMLMPDRYTSDTSGKNMTITQTQWVTTYHTVCHDVFDWQWPYLHIIGIATAVADVPKKTLTFTAATANDGIAFEANVQPQVANSLQLTLTSVANTDKKTTQLQVLEEVNGTQVVLASNSLNTGINRLTFTPTGNHITWRILGPYLVKVGTVCVTQAVMQQQSVLVDVSNTDGDKYRFGYNGQEKVNEWAGLGNHNTAEFWEYDTRIGRRANLDPKPEVGLSPYAVFDNNPIWFSDVDGDKKKKRKSIPKPEVIGSTRGQLTTLTNDEIVRYLDNNHISQNTNLSNAYLVDLVSKEAISLTMYDRDGNKTYGGVTTIGIGHAIHFGAIGSTQYDKLAVEKERPYANGITLDKAFQDFSGDLDSRLQDVSNWQTAKGVTDADQAVFSVFTDVYFNGGTKQVKKAMDVYKKSGTKGLITAIKSGAIKNPSKERKTLRLNLLNGQTPSSGSSVPNSSDEKTIDTNAKAPTIKSAPALDSSIPGR